MHDRPIGKDPKMRHKLIFALGKCNHSLSNGGGYSHSLQTSNPLIRCQQCVQSFRYASLKEDAET